MRAMQLTSLLTAAGLAVSATNAFLLPLTEPSDNDKVTTLPVPIVTDFTSPKASDIQNLKLACPGCPVSVGHRKNKVKTDIPSHLELDFSIDHAPDHDRLMMNGFELYPRTDRIPSMLAAQLLPDPEEGATHLSSHRKHRKPVMHPLGYALSATPLAKSKEDNMELIEIALQIIEVEDVFVDGIPSVELKLIKTPEGGLLIGDLKTAASQAKPKTPMDKQEECTTMLCKWRAVLMQQLGRLHANKTCGGRRPAGNVEGAHRHPPSGGHRMQHHRQHRFSHLLKNIASHILLPIAIGIAAGIFASVLGMLVGTAIVCLWRTFVRRPSTRRHHHRRSHSSHKAASSEAAATEEKAGLMTHQEDEMEAPPAYVEEGQVDNKTADEN